MNKFLPIVGVMGSGKDLHEDLTSQVGGLLSKMPVHLLTGSGQGVMLSVSKAFCKSESRKGLCIGIVPSEDEDNFFISKKGYPNPYVELAIRSPLGIYGGTDEKHISRNHINIMTSHAVIVLPGNEGTLNEVNIALKLKKPIIMFGNKSYFSSFPENIERTEDINRIDNFLNKTLEFERVES